MDVPKFQTNRIGPVFLGILLLAALFFGYADFAFVRYFAVERHNHGDMDLYYRLGLMLREGERDIYNPAVYREYYSHDPKVHQEKYRHHYRINYPPLTYALFSPLSRIPLNSLKGFWFYLNCLLLIATVVIIFLMKPFSELPEKFRYLLGGLFLIFAFCFSPVNESLFRGQINILLLFLVVVGLFFHDRGNTVLSGIFIALASSLKLIPLVLALVFIIRREWKAVLTMIIVLLIIHVGLLAIYGPDLARSFFNFWPHSMDGLITHEFNKSVEAMFYRLFSRNAIARPMIEAPGLIRPLGIIRTLLILPVMVLVLVKMTKRGGDDPVIRFLSFFLVFQTFFLLSFLVFGHHLVLILPAIAVLSAIAGNPVRNPSRGKIPLYLYLFCGTVTGALAGIIPNTFHFMKHPLWAMRILYNHNLFAQPVMILSWIFLIWFISDYLSTLDEATPDAKA